MVLSTYEPNSCTWLWLLPLCVICALLGYHAAQSSYSVPIFWESYMIFHGPWQQGWQVSQNIRNKLPLSAAYPTTAQVSNCCHLTLSWEALTLFPDATDNIQCVAFYSSDVILQILLPLQWGDYTVITRWGPTARDIQTMDEGHMTYYMVSTSSKFYLW